MQQNTKSISFFVSNLATNSAYWKWANIHMKMVLSAIRRRVVNSAWCVISKYFSGWASAECLSSVTSHFVKVRHALYREFSRKITKGNNWKSVIVNQKLEKDPKFNWLKNPLNQHSSDQLPLSLFDLEKWCHRIKIRFATKRCCVYRFNFWDTMSGEW
jgi:hypothetical protein